MAVIFYRFCSHTDSDQTEHDYHYGEEKEDSDTESGGGVGSRGNSKRYSDRARAKTPENVITAPPAAFKLDEKKSISVKNTIKPAGATAAAAAIKPAKKIDLGAATNYGKAADFGINSPTHRNTHNDEDLFVSSPEAMKAPVKSNNAIIEDIFSSAGADDDDFDPRADEKEPTADFGDFESAFTGPAATVKPAAVQPPTQTVTTEFADFASFNAAPATTNQSDIDNFLFSSPPPQQSSAAAPTSFAAAPSSTTNFLDGADLFGNNVITSAFTSPPTSLTGVNKDLLSDFDNLTLQPVRGEMRMLRFDKLKTFLLHFSYYYIVI